MSPRFVFREGEGQIFSKLCDRSSLLSIVSHSLSAYITTLDAAPLQRLSNRKVFHTLCCCSLVCYVSLLWNEANFRCCFRFMLEETSCKNPCFLNVFLEQCIALCFYLSRKSVKVVMWPVLPPLPESPAKCHSGLVNSSTSPAVSPTATTASERASCAPCRWSSTTPILALRYVFINWYGSLFDW